MDIKTFKYDKLIAIVKKLGSSPLYQVSIVGMGDHFETSIEAAGQKEAADHVIEELTFAAHHPHKFFNRRKLAAETSGGTPLEVQAMIDVANEAVAYAERNKEYLVSAVLSIDEKSTRQLGGVR